MDVFIVITLAVFGAAFGSFAGAMMWRLRAQQLIEDKAAGEKVDAKELKRLQPLIKQGMFKGRSIDLDTGKQLPWYDLLPIVSWVMLRGRSRFSGKPIGWLEPTIEVLVAVLFVLSYIFWPYDLSQWHNVLLLALWLVGAVGLAILLFYDAKWSLLPDKVVYPLIILGVVMMLVRAFAVDNPLGVLIDSLLAVGVLAGLYWFLYVLSAGRWVGFGDVKLCIFLGLALGNIPLALICLFMANFLGCLYVAPGMLLGRISRGSRVPFGPFLIAAFFITGIFGQLLVEMYVSWMFY